MMIRKTSTVSEYNTDGNLTKETVTELQKENNSYDVELRESVLSNSQTPIAETGELGSFGIIVDNKIGAMSICDELEIAARPLVEFLHRYYSPYTAIIVEYEQLRVCQDIIGCPIELPC